MLVSEADIGVEYQSVEDDWLYAEIGRRVRDARRSAGLTQVALGQSVGLARTSITNIETGNQQPTVHALWRIGGVLGVSPCALLPDWPAEPVRTDPRLPDDVPEATRAILIKIAAQPPKGGSR